MKRSPLRRKKVMRRRSKKMAETYEVRRELVESMLKKYPRCQAGMKILAHLFALVTAEYIAPFPLRERTAGLLAKDPASLTCGGMAAPTEVHEVLRRSAGGSITDESNCMAVCRTCHAWVHQNPKAARELGLLRSRYDGRN